MKPMLPLAPLRFVSMLLGVFIVGALSLPARAATEFKPKSIALPEKATSREQLAAREIRRYTYLRTGTLLPITTVSETAPARAILVGSGGNPLMRSLCPDVASLRPQEYWLKSVDDPERPVLLVTGGDDVAVLYAAYRLAEHLGARFYLDGDVLPDKLTRLALPLLDEKAAPLFALRGIQPFHDFPEGPDWWNRDDYCAVLSQLPKMRMNFFGLHTYPEGGPNAEPTVWIGRTEDIGKKGAVKFSYPSSYQNTLRGNWGYSPRKTGAYACGASQLFEKDDFGGDVMRGQIPQPSSAGGSNEVFDRTAVLLRAAFEHARELGIKTCVGTETPLTVPQALREHLKSLGKDPADPATVAELYRGLFRRIAQAYPIDYYWFWTPEGWTWEGTKEEQVKRTIDDLLAGVAAARDVGVPFQLATCGWVLGPQQDRSMFDKILPKEMPVSCINREVGKTPVDRGFANVSGRGKWAIPWLEDDPALTAPQLWVGRMRRDAADARRYGCDGLMGIHWRTRIVGPAASALAQAAWTQTPWNPHPDAPLTESRVEGPVGGKLAEFPGNPITGTDNPGVYQTVRYDVSAYHLKIPNGRHTVTLQFCEPHYDAPGRRVFQVHVQGQRREERLDVLERVGRNRALDLTCKDVLVQDGWLDIEFMPIIEFPSIAGIVVEGDGFKRKINCGGLAAGDYAADWPASPSPESCPGTADFFADWATHQFGVEVGVPAARIFQKIDGRLPRPADWVDGPGGVRPDPRPWAVVEKDYDFVGELEALLPGVKSAGNRDRFTWWINTFRYHRAMGRINCLWAQYNQAFARVKAGTDAQLQKQLARDVALPARRELVAAVAEMYQALLATISNPGELGTVMNWESHNFPSLLDRPGEELARVLGEPLPDDAQLPTAYHGPTRVIVPTVRTSLPAGEALDLKILLLTEAQPKEATVYWRSLGKGRYNRVSLTHENRGVYRARIPATEFRQGVLEYYVMVRPEDGPTVRFPASAPRLNQTVVITP